MCADRGSPSGASRSRRYQRDVAPVQRTPIASFHGSGFVAERDGDDLHIYHFSGETVPTGTASTGDKRPASPRDEKCVRQSDAWSSQTSLFASWSAWATNAGEKPWTRSELSEEFFRRKVSLPRSETPARASSACGLWSLPPAVRRVTVKGDESDEGDAHSGCGSRARTHKAPSETTSLASLLSLSRLPATRLRDARARASQR